MTPRASQAGFSVIEALVAVAIVAVAFVALATLQIQVSRTFAQQRALWEQIRVQHNAIAVLRDLNVMERPTGTTQLGEVRLRWAARPISQVTRTTNSGAGDGAFEVVLYRVSVVVDHGRQEPALSPFVIEKLGWRAVASPQAHQPTE